MSSKTILGAIMMVLAAGLAGGGFYAARTMKQEKVDPETLCPVAGSKSTTLIIIDKTDPLTEAEHIRARDLIASERNLVQRGDRITVKLLQQRAGTHDVVLDTIADLCNPGADANPLFENPKRVAARYQSAFLEPIDNALESVADLGSAPSSPIARSIEATVESSIAPTLRHFKLILISDLMEHSPEASAYTGTLSDAALRKLLPDSIQNALKDAEIRVLLLKRTKYASQQDAAVKIWARFLHETTGRAPDIVRP
jgi:hypothetical protein